MQAREENAVVKENTPRPILAFLLQRNTSNSGKLGSTRKLTGGRGSCSPPHFSRPHTNILERRTKLMSLMHGCLYGRTIFMSRRKSLFTVLHSQWTYCGLSIYRKWRKEMGAPGVKEGIESRVGEGRGGRRALRSPSWSCSQPAPTTLYRA